MLRRSAPLAIAATLAGCGAGDDKPVQLPERSSAVAYKGTTSQRERISVDVAAQRAKATLKLNLRCKDGGETTATVATEPRRPQVQPDGSFYYSETGKAKFAGFGVGRYRTAVAGQLNGPTGAGNASFRISFKSTVCRANARWRVRHT